jgi:hypothetical protein
LLDSQLRWDTLPWSQQRFIKRGTKMMTDKF